MSAKKIKPSNRKVVFNKELNKWINLEDEAGIMELQRVKMQEAKKLLEDQEDEPEAKEKEDKND